MESLGFFKNCCIKRSQSFPDCFVGNKIALTVFFGATKASRCSQDYGMPEWRVSLWPCFSPHVSDLWYCLCNSMIAVWIFHSTSVSLIARVVQPGDKSGLCKESVASSLLQQLRSAENEAGDCGKTWYGEGRWELPQGTAFCSSVSACCIVFLKLLKPNSSLGSH